MIGILILVICFVTVIIWLWVGGIDYMMKHHKDYKGEDFLNWKNDKDNNTES